MDEPQRFRRGWTSSALLDTPLDQISDTRLRANLAAAGDEDDRLEVKGAALRPEHVFRAVAGLANREGGHLVIGATRLASGGWEPTGCAIPGEPGQWLARVVRDDLRPPPQVDPRTWEVAPGCTSRSSASSPIART